ncbi:MAG: thioesterase family protein [Bacilli bacterium]
MTEYIHRVNYYETDKMGITHHSNYIRFMEEARIKWLDDIGFSYKRCESMGIISPVLSVDCQYKKDTTFDDIITIKVRLKEYTGIRMVYSYEMFVGSSLVALASSSHCFVTKEGIPVRIKRDYPELNQTLLDNIEPDTEE